MDTDALQTFLWICREGSVTRAAARVHLTQPAVSAQLAGLEETLGHRLFDRTSKGMVLTEAGRTYQLHAVDALERLDAARTALHDLAGLRTGRLAIGGGATATTYLLPQALGEFRRRYPGVRLYVREQGSEAVVRSLLSGEIELGVVTLPLAAAERTASERLRVLPWLEDELVLLVPPRDPLEGRRTFRFRDLAGRPLVLFEAGSAVRDLLDERAAAAGVEVNVAMELRSIDAIQQMVRQGVGAGFVSRHALTGRRRGLRCADGPIARRLALAFRPDRTLSAAANAFLPMLSPRLSGR